MKRLIITGIIVLVCLKSIYPQALSALEIIRKADEKNRGNSSQGEMTMSVIRTDWNRSVTMKFWSKGNDLALILITSPPKEKGQVFLKRNTEMWNWIPSIDRMVKIPPSMMLQSWMGSDFTNDDLVKQSSIIKDYSHKLLGKETIRGVECYKVELIPKPDATVVWGKLLSWITVEGFDQWKSESYDEDMTLVYTENAFNIRNMGDRSIPTRMEIVPADKKGQKTVLEINRMVFNQPIQDSFFSQQNMKKVR